MTNSMAMELKAGTIIKLNILVTLKTERSQDKVDSNSKEAFMKENSLMESSMEWASTTSQTQANYTKVNSKTILWTAKAS